MIQLIANPNDSYSRRVRTWSGAVWLAAFAAVMTCGAPARAQESAADPRHGLGALGEVLPRPLLEISFLELRLWQWAGLILLLGAAVLASWILAAVLLRIGRSIVSRTETLLDDRLLERLFGPFRLILTVALFAVGSVLLALSGPAYRFLNTLELVSCRWCSQSPGG